MDDEGPFPPSWAVERDGASSTVLGTMHAEVDVDALDPELFDALDDARVLLSEADVRAVDRDAFLETIVLPPDVTLQAAVSAQDFEAISRAVAPFLGDDSFNRMQPWFLESQIVLAHLPEGIEAMDAGLVQRAEEAGVPLAFFETWQAQVALLNGLGFDDGLSVLLPTARDPEAAVAAHMTWAAAFEAGDAERMEALAFDAAARAARPAYYEEIVFRHEGWMPQLVDELARGDVFVAVGFMHLLTDRGLLALLEGEGFTVTRR